MSVKKGHAYLIGIACIIGIYVTALINRFPLVDIYQATLTAIVTLTIGYIGGNVVDNGVKGKFYNPALDKQKNG